MSDTVTSNEVIRLRPLSPDDAETQQAGCDPAIVDSLGGGQPPTGAQVRHWLAEAEAAWATGGHVVDLHAEAVSLTSS